MKNIIFTLTALIGALGFLNPAVSQITDVCGNDTVILRVSNYHYGTIEWEKSTDMEAWISIPNARDTVYSFLPEESMYYRAVVKFADCPPEFSEISFVQMPPVANAGFDRTVPGNEVILYANRVPGANGSWSIAGGTNGTISDISQPNAVLSGTDTLYTLVWTLTNACGTSRDTVRVRFIQNIYIDHYAVVDTTDVILSDQAQLAAGLYIIQFSDPVPVISDSTILVGMGGSGFLRKVESFTVNGNVFTMQTSQAALEDITIQGAFDLAQTFSIDTVLDAGAKSSGGYERLNRLPTRHELNTDPRFRTGNFYFETRNQPVYLYPGVTLGTRNQKDSGPLIDLSFNRTLFSYGPLRLDLSGNYSFDPNLVVDLEYYLARIYYFKMGLSNARVENNFQLSLVASSGYSLADYDFTLFAASKNVVFIIGGVPVVIEVDFSIAGGFDAGFEAEASASINLNATATYNSHIQYSHTGGWTNWHRAGNNVSLTPDYSISGSFEQNFHIGPEISFKIYGQVGPYLHIKFKEAVHACFNNLNWEAGVNLGAELTLGATAEMMGLEIFDYNKMWPGQFYSYSYPYDIHAWSGDNQTYTPGEELSNSIKVKINSNRGISLPWARVHFLPKCGGSVRDSVVTTDGYGFAETFWTPGDTIRSTLEAFVVDCNDELIRLAPLVFVAHADTTDPCASTSLAVSVLESEGILSPLAAMGVPPYLYSTDGVDFSANIPEISAVPGQEYTFVVKDDQECIAMVNYTAEDPCEKSTLSINFVTSGTSLTVETFGGVPPYQFSVNGGSFSPSITVLEAIPGQSTTITVKDMLDCTETAHYTVPHPCDMLKLMLTAEEGTIYAQASGGNPPYLFSLSDTLNFSSVNVFENLAGGLYTVYVKDSEGCINSLSISVPIEEVVIGNQIWMKQNLAVDVGNNWWPQAKYCLVFQMDPNQGYGVCLQYYWKEHTEYGRLYDWESAIAACASIGWRLPTDAEWQQLIDSLGGWYVAGFKLKSTTTSAKIQVGNFTHSNPDGHPFWYEPNTGATNESGFSAFPGGWRLTDGSFYSIGYDGYW